MNGWGHLPANFSAQKDVDRLRPRGAVKHVIQEVRSKRESKSEPSVGRETGPAEGGVGQNLRESSSVLRKFLCRKEHCAALSRLYCYSAAAGKEEAMSMLCRLGFHSWTACTCDRCGEIRDKDHPWEGCKCTICGKTRDRDHVWGDEKCRVCGAKLPTDEAAKRWADRLKNNKDYRTLAAYLCTYHCDPSGSGYERSNDLWNAKNRYALSALREVGTEAIDAMLSELDTGEHKNNRVADVLMEIGDPKAVPVLKKLLDRGEWDSTAGQNDRTREFVNKYPQYQGEVEKVACAICRKIRPVTETEQCDDKRFCVGYCWSKRGRVIEHGIGMDCPFYSEGICTAGDSDLPCCLYSGSYKDSCEVYAMHKGAAGVRRCASCGAQWRSTYGAMKDLSLFGPHASVSATYDPQHLMGLTCTHCGKSYCKGCLSGRVPSSLPGGSCPACGAKLDLA